MAIISVILRVTRIPVRQTVGTLLLMSLPALVLLLSALAPGSAPSYQTNPVTLRADVTTGSKISGEQNFRVLVSTDDIVTKVEMYVGTELRGEESSTPYKFSIDTINEKDGPMDVKWVAYTDAGHKGSLVLHLTVDNGQGLGAAAHVKTGTDLLRSGKPDDAITQGRIALKIDKKFVPARFLLAEAYAQAGVYDKAQKYVQDVLDDEPKNLAAMDLSSSISLRQAFNVFSHGDQNDEALKVIGTAFKSAVDNRKVYLEAKMDALGTPKDDASLLAYADAAIAALRYTLAINALTPFFKTTPARADVADRLAYAQLRAGRISDALGTLDLLKKVGANNSDAYSQALRALIQARLGDTVAANASMEEAELNDISNVGVQTAQASIALMENNTKTLGQIVTSLAKDEGQRSEVDYLLAALYNKTGDYVNERKYFELAVLAEPLNYDMYIEEGNGALAIIRTSEKDAQKKFQFSYAELMYKTALQAKNESFEAMTGLSLVNTMAHKLDDAFKYAQQAVNTQPDYVPGQLALSASAHELAKAIRPRGLPKSGDDAAKTAYDDAMKRAADLEQISVTAAATAAKLDEKEAGGRAVPDSEAAYQYYVRYGRSAVMSRP